MELSDRLFGSHAIIFLLFLTFIIHGLSLAAVYAIASSLDLALSLGVVCSAVPVVLLISIFPVSVSGWGVREGAMIVVLSGFGISSTNAATLSVVFGLFQLIVGLSGVVFVFWPMRGHALLKR